MVFEIQSKKLCSSGQGTQTPSAATAAEADAQIMSSRWDPQVNISTPADLGPRHLDIP